MSKQSSTLSRRALLGATVTAGAGLVVATRALLAGDEPAGIQTDRYMIYVPNWDFSSEQVQDVFGDALVDALAESLTKSAYREERKRNAQLLGGFTFDPRILMGGCVSALTLSDALVKRLGQCLLAKLPGNAREPVKRTIDPVDLAETANPMEKYVPQKCGCIFMDVSDSHKVIT